MLPYWLLFLIPAYAALRERPGQHWHLRRQPLLLGAVALLGLMIGFRYQVGGDWGSYIAYLYSAQFMGFLDALMARDPGYILLNWLASNSINEIWLVNLACGLIFSIGLVSFARTQPRPWLVIAVAVPYLVIVVAMGYSRQGVAIGLTMLGIVALVRDRSTLKFILWIAFAASFHRSAVMLVPIAALSMGRGRYWAAIWVGIATIVLYFLFLDDSVDSLVSGYIEAEYQSQGAAIRIAMNALPSAMLLIFRKRFPFLPGEWLLWRNMGLLSLFFVVLLIVSPSSTAVDRVALYLIPVQLFVLSRLPDAFPSRRAGVDPMVLMVVLYSAAVQFIWLNFAGHSSAWVPYQLYPLV
ncbi:EpsG family protein [Devosia enhydra]|uniref:EpsG family protein n=1 Tax=Devosia enhydra TaxID=665118 RepID=A0A1K2HS54_9HYPH|nr:EpsG family protein [Devosia enhydra]SFZ80669.1 EpsG family protein [Devosia enhydra]